MGYPTKSEFVAKTTALYHEGKSQAEARDKAARSFGFVDFKDLLSRAKAEQVW